MRSHEIIFNLLITFIQKRLDIRFFVPTSAVAYDIHSPSFRVDDDDDDGTSNIVSTAYIRLFIQEQISNSAILFTRSIII